MARKPEPPPRPSKITIPARAHPLARLVFSEMQHQRVTYFEMEMRSGVLTSTIKAWRNENAPGLETIAACLGSVGWTLVPVPAEDRLPPRIREGLAALADEWGEEEPLLHRLLASCCRAPIIKAVTPARNPTGHVSKRKARATKVTPASQASARPARGFNPNQIGMFG